MGPEKAITYAKKNFIKKIISHDIMPFEQLIKFVAILKPDVCIISKEHKYGVPIVSTLNLLLHILKNNSAAENCTVVRLGQVDNWSIFYNIWNSWLQTFHSFYFRFQWPDSEKHQ